MKKSARASLFIRQAISLQVQLSWAGHVVRVEDISMNKAVFFGELKQESTIVVLQERLTKTG